MRLMLIFPAAIYTVIFPAIETVIYTVAMCAVHAATIRIVIVTTKIGSKSKCGWFMGCHRSAATADVS